MKNITTREFIKVLQAFGFIAIATKGSHAIFQNPKHKQRIVLPIRNSKAELDLGLIKAISKILIESGIASKEEIDGLLQKK